MTTDAIRNRFQPHANDSGRHLELCKQRAATSQALDRINEELGPLSSPRNFGDLIVAPEAVCSTDCRPVQPGLSFQISGFAQRTLLNAGDACDMAMFVLDWMGYDITKLKPKVK
jgi:hypothetical protein